MQTAVIMLLEYAFLAFGTWTVQEIVLISGQIHIYGTCPANLFDVFRSRRSFTDLSSAAAKRDGKTSNSLAKAGVWLPTGCTWHLSVGLHDWVAVKGLEVALPKCGDIAYHPEFLNTLTT